MTSKITLTFLPLYRRALATGQDQRSDLAGGASLVVRVEQFDDGSRVVTLTIARVRARVGAGEEVVFRRDCGVPPGAVRTPADPALQAHRERDGRRYFIVGYSWVERPEAAREAA